MYVWFLAGLTLGILLRSLLRLALRSPSMEITYLTLLSLFDKRSTADLAKRASALKLERETSLRAAAGRISLL